MVDFPEQSMLNFLTYHHRTLGSALAGSYLNRHKLNNGWDAKDYQAIQQMMQVAEVARKRAHNIMQAQNKAAQAKIQLDVSKERTERAAQLRARLALAMKK